MNLERTIDTASRPSEFLAGIAMLCDLAAKENVSPQQVTEDLAAVLGTITVGTQPQASSITFSIPPVDGSPATVVRVEPQGGE